MLPQKMLQFYVISMEFLSLRCRRLLDVPPDETSLATRSKAKRLYSQARITESYR